MATGQDKKREDNLHERVVSMQKRTEEIIGTLSEMIGVEPQNAKPDIGGPGTIDLLAMRLQDLAWSIALIGRTVKELALRIGSG